MQTKAMHVEGMPEGWTARVLFLRKPDGAVEAYAPLVLYLKHYWTRSSTWQDTVTRAVGLFWDFLQAHAASNAMSAGGAWRSASFASFARSLLTGTMENGFDPLGLFWPGMPYARALLLLRAIEDFLEWFHHECRDRDAMTRKAMAKSARPDDGLTFSDLLIWSRVRKLSMLKHLSLPEKIRRVSHFDIGPNPRGSDIDPVKHFPATHATKLIFEGHRRPTRRGMHAWNIRDQMIALLCEYGGLRRSEPLHLYIDDVILDPDPERPSCALVVLHHPAEAKITFTDALGSRATANRKDYLREMFDLPPRHLVKRGRYHAGWKGMLLDKKLRSIVFWSDIGAAQVFFHLYKIYVRDIRPEKMRLREQAGGMDHPFLFVSEGSSHHGDGGACVGDPYSIKAYERNHRAAVLRLGLPYGKDEGTTTHGLRHAYCQSLVNLGVAAPVIQQAVHHRNPLSQIRYTEAGAAKTSRILNSAKQKRLEALIDFDRAGSESTLALRNYLKNLKRGG